MPDQTPRIIGTIIHRILQQLSKQGIDWWKNNSIASRRGYVDLQLRQAGLKAESLNKNIEHICSVIDNVILDQRGQWILHPHHDAKSEFALTAILDDKPENIIVDRCFIDETGTRWIIDYKTSNDFTAAETKKYLPQMQKYAQAFQLLEKNPISMGLYFPCVLGWVVIS